MRAPILAIGRFRIRSHVLRAGKAEFVSIIRSSTLLYSSLFATFL